MSTSIGTVTQYFLEEQHVRDETSLTDILSVIVCILSMPGNVVTVFVILSSNVMRRKPVNILILSQSCIDMGVCIASLCYQYISSLDGMSHGIGSVIYCKVWLTGSLYYCFLIASSYNLLVLSAERYMAITRPLSYSEEKVRKRIPIILLITIIFALLTPIPDFIYT